MNNQWFSKVAVWLVIALVLFTVFKQFDRGVSQGSQIGYSDFLEEVRAKLADRGVVFAFARVKHDILGPLQTYGLVDRVGADRLFPTLPTAEAAYRAWESEQAGGRHRPPPADVQSDARADTPADD